MNEVEKWINISKSDIKSSKILLDNGCYSQSYFYFQQASEKANKANWMLNGTLDESQLKNIGHNQFKPLRKNLITKKGEIDYLIALKSKLDFISENPILKNIDINDYTENIGEGLKFIDRLKNQNLFDFEESTLNEILQNLKELKLWELELPEDFSERIKKALNEYMIWLLKFDLERTNEEADKILEIINDQEKFKNYIDISKEQMSIAITQIYTSYTFFFCSILTVQHSNSTRYPQELDGQSPTLVYNENLEIIKKQEQFLDCLNDALDRLSEISINYKPIKIEEIIEATEKIKPFKTPDTRWKNFSVNSESDFRNQFLVSNSNHKDVPENIKEELIHFEKLQLLSYYHYPAYGDAFSRLTRIFEMAVKAKARLLNIDLNRSSGKEKTLNTLIQEIGVGYNNSFRGKLNWGRRMRNMNAHPDLNIFYGNILQIPLISMVNIINDIFRTKDFFENEDEIFKKMKSDYKAFESGLWKLDQYLIHSVEVFAVRNDFSLWGFYPVLLNYPSKEKNNLFIIEPFFAIVKHHKIVNDSLILETIDNLKIEINSTIIKENIDSLRNYQNQIDLASVDTKKSVELGVEQSIGCQIEVFKHLISIY